MKKFVLMSFCFLVFSGSAFADWDPQDPAKWVQLPDTTGNGMALELKKVTNYVGVADDWLCNSAGPVTDIHIWGAWWMNDVDLGGVTFTLNIYDNIPAPPTGGFSMPGEQLWTSEGKQMTVLTSPYSSGVSGGWWQARKNGTYQSDMYSDIYQYNFTGISEPFVQDGSSTYWLEVQAEADEPSDYFFGWLASTDHWEDTATRNEFVWQPLYYPSEHQYAGGNIDMAFVIAPEPTTIALLGMGGLAVLRRRRKVS
jgi:hypothetical protein